MCTGITETTAIAGSGKGKDGWFVLDSANVSYDHPYHAPVEHALNIDFVNAAAGPGARVAVELTADSARRLVDAILVALERGAVAEARQ
ncbi:MAG: DUF6295 family protein [Chloroflexi bacterium]|nr:DUF6295 family protein [Chloroflexota bacterium]